MLGLSCPALLGLEIGAGVSGHSWNHRALVGLHFKDLLCSLSSFTRPISSCGLVCITISNSCSFRNRSTGKIVSRLHFAKEKVRSGILWIMSSIKERTNPWAMFFYFLSFYIWIIKRKEKDYRSVYEEVYNQWSKHRFSFPKGYNVWRKSIFIWIFSWRSANFIFAEQSVLRNVFGVSKNTEQTSSDPWAALKLFRKG
jgi:hypothetical protein